jgi:hypothetical protein
MHSYYLKGCTFPPILISFLLNIFWGETQLTNSIVESATEFSTQTKFYPRIRIRILVSELSASEFQHGE